MKGKRWFFILLLTIFLVNIGVFVALRYFSIDKILLEYSVQLIEDNYDVTLSIDSYNINDRQLRLTGVKLQDENDQYTLTVRQIYVNYNLLKALFSNIKLFKTVESITLIEPHLTLTLESGEGRKGERVERWKGEKVPDISDYFSNLNISAGKLDISYKGNYFTFKNSFSPVTVDIDNHHLSRINILVGEGNNLFASFAQNRFEEDAALTNRQDDLTTQRTDPFPDSMDSNNDEISSSITIQAVIDKESLQRLDFNIVNFTPDSLYVTTIDEVTGTLDLKGRIVDNEIAFNAKIKDSRFYYNGFELYAEQIDCVADHYSINLLSDRIFIDDNKIGTDIKIEDYLNPNPYIFGSIKADNIPVNRYVESIEGFVSAEITASGIITSPELEGSIKSDKVVVWGETVRDIEISAKYFSDIIPLSLLQADWQGNRLSGEGIYSFQDGFNFQLNHDNLSFVKAGLHVKADKRTDISYKDIFSMDSVWEGVSIHNENFSVNNLNLTASVNDKAFETRITGNRLESSLSGDIGKQAYKFNAEMRRFSLNNALQFQLPTLRSYPDITGRVEAEYENGLVNTSTLLRMSNIHSGNLEGNITGELIYDVQADSSYIGFQTINGYHNFEPFKIELTATGTSKVLKTDTFSLNDELFFNVELSRNAGTEESSLRTKKRGKDRSYLSTAKINSSIEIEARKIDIQKYLRYVLPYHTANRFSGTTDINISIDNDITGTLRMTELSFDKVGDFNNRLTFSTSKKEQKRNSLSQEPLNDEITPYNNGQDSPATGDLLYDYLEYKNILTAQDDTPVMEINGITELGNSYNTRIRGDVKEFSLSSLQDTRLQGDLSSVFTLETKQKTIFASLDLTAAGIRYNDILDIDIIELVASQEEDRLIIEKLYSAKEGDYRLSAAGQLSYNLFRNTILDGEGDIVVEYSGDILSQLSSVLNRFEYGKSTTEAIFRLTIADEELSITEGSLNLSRGELHIKDQLKPITDINLEIDITNNIMSLKRCVGKAGDGLILARNEVLDDEDDFRIGMLNLGRFFVKTSNAGIPVHIPNIFPQGITANVIVRGRNSDEGVILGPFDNIRMIGECLVSNVSIIYPANTENLFKLINIAADRRKKKVTTQYPVDIDLMLIAGERVRYVTYPLNLLLEPGGHLHLLYRDGSWIPADGLLSSASGNLDFFGTLFNTDFANLMINYEIDDYRLRGYFYKYAADGSLITISVFNDADVTKDDFLNNLNFNIESDNPEDRTILHILSKVRYNRRLEDMPRSQQNALLQDEFLQLAGIGLSGAIIDPFISPVENSFRRIFRVDYFSIKPGFMENLVRTYGYSEREEELQPDNEIAHFGRNILLNNLSVNVGKFFAKDMYLDYEFLLQKPTEVVAVDEDLLVYQSFTVHYNLPLRMRLAYRFYLNPEEQPNAHEIFVRRSFSFW